MAAIIKPYENKTRTNRYVERPDFYEESNVTYPCWVEENYSSPPPKNSHYWGYKEGDPCVILKFSNDTIKKVSGQSFWIDCLNYNSTLNYFWRYYFQKGDNLPFIVGLEFSFNHNYNIIPGEYNVQCNLWRRENITKIIETISLNIKQGKPCTVP